MASVKPEPAVKPDPEDAAAAAASPAVMSDDDLYEDAGDLEFYDPNVPGDPNGNLFLAHVPAYLYEAWAQMNEGEEVEVGKMRRWTETDKNGQTRTRMAMLLDGNNSSHQSIPKEYNFDMRDTNLLNTFVFTEQDLPGFKSKAQGANSNIPGHLRNRFNRNQNSNNNNNNKQEGGRKRYQPYYRKAIPKKTALAGRFKYEVNCHPANTAESKHLLAVRNSESAIPKATTSMMSGTRAMTKNIIHAGTLTGNAKMSGFIQTTDAKAKAKKPQAERAARLDRHELLDRLAACFTQYRYWTMKAFKQQLNQPEAWLRENLDNIGTLHKTGPFANHWELNEVYKKSLQSTDNMAQGGTAPGDMGGDDSDFDGDDDNIEMEDVPAIA